MYLECTAVSLVLSASDNIVSLSSPPREVVYPPGFMVPPWVTASLFLAGNRKAELIPDIFSLLLLFRIFLFPLLLPTKNIVTLSAA